MFRRNRLLAAASSLLICATALAAAPSVAAAQPSRPEAAPSEPAGDGYAPEPDAYDACHRDRVQRGTGGALLGAGLGALAGSNVAGKGARTEGAVLGGVLGAIIGGNVGASSTACVEGEFTQPARDAQAADDAEADAYAGDEPPPATDQGYAGGPPPAAGPGYGQSHDSAETCRVKKRRVVQADGSVRKEFVRVCRSSSTSY